MQARALKPANKEVLAMVAAVRFAAARTFSAEGRFDEARVELSAIDSDGGAQTLPAYDVTVARAMVEHMAARPETARQLVEQALAQADDPADVFMLLTIEADRHDLPFQLNDLPSQYRQQWESSLKKRRSRAAGSMARRIMDFMAELQEFKGKSGFLNGYLERVLKYVTGCNRIRWDAEDLLHVCQFLDRVVDDPNYRAETYGLAEASRPGTEEVPPGADVSPAPRQGGNWPRAVQMRPRFGPPLPRIGIGNRQGIYQPGVPGNTRGCRGTTSIPGFARRGSAAAALPAAQRRGANSTGNI